MATSSAEKISVSLPKGLIRYADEYRQQHGISSRSEVFAQALVALREAELIRSYKRHALEVADPLLDVGVSDGLVPSTADDR